MAEKFPSPEELMGCVSLRLRKVTRKVTQIYDQAFAPLGLTSTQFSLLGYLAMKDDFAVGELAERLMMDPTTLTRVLRPLERDGHVAVTASQDDRRRRGIALTRSGRKIFAEALPLWRNARAQLTERIGKQGCGALDASLAHSLARFAQA